MFDDEFKRDLRQKVDTDRLRPVLSVALDVVMSVESFVERARDLVRPTAPPIPAGMVTAVIKTFQRPREVRRLVSSMQRVQPDLSILVVDDNRSAASIPGAELLKMPFNSGISVGRNAALAQIRTPYFLLLDDDFIFTRDTAIAGPLALIDGHPMIDILGGAVVNLPDFSIHDYSLVTMDGHPARPRFQQGSTAGGLPVYAKVPNFFIGRTATVRAVGWTDELKVMEHHEFFWRAWGVLTTVYDENLRVLHARNPFDRSSVERAENMTASHFQLRQIYSSIGLEE